jgi:hypothetical protein
VIKIRANQILNDQVLSKSRDKLMKRIISIVVLSVGFAVACNSFGKDAPKANPFKATLAVVPAAELPAKSADLVLQAKARARQTVTVNVVKAAVGINPAAAPAIVGAIARAVPDMASVAAGTAAAEQPKQASAIAKAAAAAAPSKAGEIVMAVCRAVPSAYQEIAAAVSQALPDASNEIVSGVGSGVPHLKRPIEKAMAGYSGNVPSVADTLSQAEKISQAQRSFPTVLGATRGPASGPPYIPISKTPTNVTSGTSGLVPSGGRNYSSP